jgi:hypothetical protein
MVTTYDYYPTDFAAATTEISNIDYLRVKMEELNLSSVLDSMATNDSGANKIFSFTFTTALSPGDKTLLDGLIAIYLDPSNALRCTISDNKTPGTNGGTFTKDIWNTRDLNNIDFNVAFLSINSNIITIDPGIYVINVTAPSCNVQSSQIRLRNITNNTFTLGSNSYSSNGITTNCNLVSRFEFDVQTQFDIQHICERTIPSIGFGRASGYGTNEVYTMLFIEKII